MTSETFSLPAADSLPLAATLTLPAVDGYPLAVERHGSGPRHLVVAGATGAPARHYRAFARHMAARGHSVWLFDYRGCGASRPAAMRTSLRGFAGGIAEWGRLDLEAVIAAARREDATPDFVGHSIGGFCLGLAPSGVHLRRIVTVAAQTALPFDAPLREWPRSLALWHGFMPLATLVNGYFPASRYGLGEDLPRRAALQWALRPLRRSFIGNEDESDVSDFVRVRAPLQAWYSPTDPLGTRRAVIRLHRRFASPAVLRDAGSLGRRFGHFDYFRRDHGEPLWAEIAAFLDAGPKSSPARLPRRTPRVRASESRRESQEAPA